MSLLYWIPEHAQPTLSPQRVEELGLGYAFDESHRPICRGCMRGPDGKSGAVVSGSSDLGYFPDRQQWAAMPDSEHGLWVGRFSDRETTPADLARERQLPGSIVRLADEQQWLVPVARRWTDEAGEIIAVGALPRQRHYAGDGRWKAGDVKARYRRLWELAMEYCGELAEAIAQGQQDPDGTVSYYLPASRDAAAVEALQVNYRVGPAELSLLGAWDDEAPQAVLDVVLDNARLDALLKKKEQSATPAGGNSSSGLEPSSPAEPVATGQP